MLIAKWIFLIWTLAASTVGSGTAVIAKPDEPGPYRELGTTVVISAGPVTDMITSISWKHGQDIAAEWFGASVTCYRHFNGRCQLNTSTGDLTIKNVTREDNGFYTAEISNWVKNPTEIQIIAPVPTPNITTSFDTEKTHCVLTCEGDITDAGPVQYSWISGDTVAPGSKTLTITQEQKEAEFGCSLKNPVSQKSSQKFQNPFIKVLETGNPAQFALFLLLLIPVILIVLCFVYRKKINERLNPGRWCNRNRGGTSVQEKTEENAQIHPANSRSENPDMNLHNGEASTPVQTCTGTSDTNTGTGQEEGEPGETENMLHSTNTVVTIYDYIRARTNSHSRRPPSSA